MSHALIHTGAGWRCLRCGTNWDQGEETGEDCCADTYEEASWKKSQETPLTDDERLF